MDVLYKNDNKTFSHAKVSTLALYYCLDMMMANKKAMKRRMKKIIIVDLVSATLPFS